MNIRTVTLEDFTFVDVHNPSDFEIKFLKHNYGFSQLHLDDYLHKQQIPKFEVEKNYTMIVLDFPHMEKPGEKKGVLPESLPALPFTSHKRHRIRTAHVTIFINGRYVVVLHDERSPEIDTIFEDCQKTLKNREEYMGLGPQYLFYRIVDTMIDTSLEVATEITATIDKIDQHLLDNNTAERIVEDISATRRNIVVFQTMMKPALSIFSDLENNKHIHFDSALTASWANIRDHIERIWYRLEDSKELIEGIATSHESLLTAKTNEIVKVLTMFTAILLPLTLMASIYGMNIVGLPHANEPHVLTTLLLIMFVMGLVMVIVFKLKKWL